MSSFDFSKITGTPIITSSAPIITQSLVMRRRRGSTFNRRTPYDQPSFENIKTGIQNLEKLIQTFYTNVYISINLEITKINEKIKELLDNNELSKKQKNTASSLRGLVIASHNPDFREMEEVEISQINKKINKLLKDKKLSEIQKNAINQITLSLNALVEASHNPDFREDSFRTIKDIHKDIKGRSDNIRDNDNHKLKYKIVLVLMIIMYKLNELLIKPNIDKLKVRREELGDHKYLTYLKKCFFNERDYFRILNIRGFYKMMIGDETLPSIDYLVSYSNFLYGLVINKEDKQKLDIYLYYEESTKLKNIPPFYYQRYFIHREHSGGRRGIKSNCVMKDIKELCKANKIKLSRIIDGKRVIYKKKELITKLKRKKIKIPKSLH